MSKRPTLKTISELSGFAVPTVSRALKDAPDIRVETKATVRRIAEDIGYIPNRTGPRPGVGKTNVVSLVLSNEFEAMDDHSGRIISSIARRLRGTNYHLNITPNVVGEERLAPIRYIVETGTADVILMAEIEYADARVDYLLEHRFPFATLGRSRRCDEHPYFDFDNTEFGRHAVRRLVDKGRRNFLLVAPPLAQSYSRHMIAGARAVASETGTHLEVLEGGNSHDIRADLGAKLDRRLRSSKPIDGIIAPSTTSAIVSVVALEKFGRRLGEDIDLVSKEPSPFLKTFRAPIIAVHEEPMIAGRFLADAAVRAIEHPELPPMQAVEIVHEPVS